MKELLKIPCVLMRGGTSKGLIINEDYLPADPSKRDKLILRVFGSPDQYQIDGIGGGTSLTSKLALIKKSKKPNIDIEFTFGQVSLLEETIDYKPTCGNMSAAVGLYALEERFSKIISPQTIVRIYNTNTKKVIEVEIPISSDNEIAYNGDYFIAGVPGTGSKINVNFLDSGGAITGKILPTGNKRDIIKTKAGKSYEVSVIDAANVVVFITADQLNINGTEVGNKFNQKSLLDILEEIRVIVGGQIGLILNDRDGNSSSQALPKIAVISNPKDYRNINGKFILAKEFDILGRYITMGTLHPAFAVSGAIALATASQISGTVVTDIVSDSKSYIKIGHPSGIIEAETDVKNTNNDYTLTRAVVGRTARRIMEGNIVVPAIDSLNTYNHISLLHTPFIGITENITRRQTCDS